MDCRISLFWMSTCLEIDGFMLLETLRDRGHDAPAVLITGLGDPEMRMRAERAGAAALFDKPIDPSVLFSTLVQLLAEGSASI